MIISFSVAAIPLPFSYFGSASNHLVLFDSVQCTGSEEMILECSHSTIGNHFCSQFSKDSTSSVAIQCQRKLSACCPN